MDLTFSASYDDSTEDVRAAILDAARADERIMTDPAPFIVVSKYKDSAIEYIVRVWCKTADYWDINFYLLEEGRRALIKAGIGIPYPQLDVHMK